MATVTVARLRPPTRSAFTAVSFPFALLRLRCLSSTRTLENPTPTRMRRPEHSLGTWHQAVSSVRLFQIQPHALGGPGDAQHAARIKTSAYYGDRALGAAVALAQRRRAERATDKQSADGNGTKGVADDHINLSNGATAGELAEVMSMAVSNKFLAAHIAAILPIQSSSVSAPGGLAKLVASSNGGLNKSAGTMVEAAIDAVYSSCPAVEASSAISNLADWLVESALRQRQGGAAKGEILDRGGTVVSQMVRGMGRGNRHHVPRFRATARLGGRCVSAEGQSRRQAEGCAAARLLRAAALDERGVKGETLREWTPPDLESRETPEDWWRRGATHPRLAFQRTSASPHIFPSEIDSVVCSVGKSGKGGTFAACVTVVASIPPTRHVFTKHGKSRSEARREACLSANRFIAKDILGLPMEKQ